MQTCPIAIGLLNMLKLHYYGSVALQSNPIILYSIIISVRLVSFCAAYATGLTCDANVTPKASILTRAVVVIQSVIIND